MSRILRLRAGGPGMATRRVREPADDAARSRRVPWWAAAAIGLACASLGAAIVFRPFASLGALVWFTAVAMLAAGIGNLASAEEKRTPTLARLVGAVWVAAAVVVVLWAGLTLR